MLKITAAATAAVLMVVSQPAFAVAKVAVAHFAPFAADIADTAVDIQVNGTTALENVVFKDFTTYLDFEAGTYTIDVIPVGSTDPAISGTFDLTDGMSYTVFASGNGITQDLTLEAVVDDTTMPASGSLNLRVIHAAPFAAELSATEVSIRTDAGDVVNNLVGVPYLGNSQFFEVPEGSYNLKVASNDGSVNYIDPLAATLPAGADVTIYAVGDGINQPLGIIAFPVGELELGAPVDNSFTGMWEILEGSGTGFIWMSIPARNEGVGSWYTYDMNGDPIFYTFQSESGGFADDMATTDLYLNTGGGNSEDDIVTTEKIGEIDFMFTCDEAMAIVTLEGQDPVPYNAAALTQGFACTDD